MQNLTNFVFVQNFYLPIRRSLTHPLCQSSSGELPRSLQQWLKIKSKKIETVVELAQHHLSADQAPPLMVKGNKLVPVDDTSTSVPSDQTSTSTTIPPASDSTAPDPPAHPSSDSNGATNSSSTPTPTSPDQSHQPSAPHQGSTTPGKDPETEPTEPSSSPDKILIFSNFPGNNTLLKTVSFYFRRSVPKLIVDDFRFWIYTVSNMSKSMDTCRQPYGPKQ